MDIIKTILRMDTYVIWLLLSQLINDHMFALLMSQTLLNQEHMKLSRNK